MARDFSSDQPETFNWHKKLLTGHKGIDFRLEGQKQLTKSFN